MKPKHAYQSQLAYLFFVFIVALAASATNAHAEVSITESPEYNFGNVVTGTSVVKQLSIINSGKTKISGLSVSFTNSSAPFQWATANYPGGGTCSTSLASWAGCTIKIKYSPTAAVLSTGGIRINWRVGLSNYTMLLGLRGTGITAATLAIAEAPILSFGDVIAGNRATRAVTLSNQGQVAATSLASSALNAPFSYSGGAYPGTGGTCGNSVAPATSCSIVIDFAPVSATQANQVLNFNYFNGVAAKVVSLTLVGNAQSRAVVTMSGSTDFGSVIVGGASSRVITLTNSGGSTASSLQSSLTPTRFSFVGGSFPGTGGTCGNSLAPAASCTTALQFSPASAGTVTGVLSFNYFDGLVSTNASANLNGSGISAALVSVVGSTDFGSVIVGGTSSRILTLTNSGGSTASSLQGNLASSRFSFFGGSFPGIGGNCGLSLAASASCTVAINFSPTVGGYQVNYLDVSYHDGAQSRTVSIGLSGTGVGTAIVRLVGGSSVTTLVGGSTTIGITLYNDGQTAASAVGIGSLSAPFSLQAGNCGTSIAPYGNCSVSVIFAPTQAGTFSANFAVNYFDGAQNLTRGLSLQGTGTTPAVLSFTQTQITFPNTVVGQSNIAFITLRNTGGGMGSSIAPSPNSPAAPFSYDGGNYPGSYGSCYSQLSAGGSCNLAVKFSPTGAGPFAGPLALGYHDGVAAQVISLDLAGSALAPAQLVFNDGPSYHFGDVSCGSPRTTYLTVTNVGQAVAQNLQANALTAPFSFGLYPYYLCGSVASGATCQIQVMFSPLTSGSYSDTLNLAYEDGTTPNLFPPVTNQAVSIALQGNGVGPSGPAVVAHTDAPYEYSPGSFHYGNVAVGSSTSHSVTFTNSGGSNATNFEILITDASAGALGLSGGSFPGDGGTCANIIPPGTSCTVVFGFTPTKSGPYVGGWKARFFDGNEYKELPAASYQNDRNSLSGVANEVAGAPGTLDVSFNGTGFSAEPAYGSVNIPPYGQINGSYDPSIARQADGKIVQASTGYASGTNVVLVRRYLENGTLDLAFGTNGHVATSFGHSYDRPSAIAVQSDGRILVAGVTNLANASYEERWALVRFLADGSLDQEFGVGGKVVTALSSYGSASSLSALRLQADGKILAVGYSNQGAGRYLDFTLVRYELNGNLDLGFGVGGVLAFGMETDGGQVTDKISAVETLTDGRIVIAGLSELSGDQNSCSNYINGGSSIVLMRLQYNGDLDASFGDQGKVIINPTDCQTFEVGGLAIDAQQRVLLAKNLIQPPSNYSYGEGAAQVTLNRYNVEGNLDSTFGTGTVTPTIPTSVSARAYGIRLLNDNKIAITGGTSDGLSTQVLVMRMLENGAMDSSFGSNADGVQRIMRFPYDRFESGSASALLQQSPDQKLLVGATLGGSPVVIRLLP